MRRMGILKQPCPANRKESVYKVMLHETRHGTFVYLYTSPDALFCSCDNWYPNLESALEDWSEEVEGWTELEDPLPYCQHDCPLPVRVKGRDAGAPEWGHYEILENGEWKEFVP